MLKKTPKTRNFYSFLSSLQAEGWINVYLNNLFKDSQTLTAEFQSAISDLFTKTKEGCGKAEYLVTYITYHSHPQNLES